MIMDIPNLNSSLLKIASATAIEVGVYGLQTGNGFGPTVTNQNVKELVQEAKGRCAIKAVGGIKTLDQVLELIDAGANQIGTSAGPQIIKELKGKQK